MLWLVVNKNGQEKLYYQKPVRDSESRSWMCLGHVDIVLPKGSIYRLIGKTLTWKDEPFEFTDVVINTVTITDKIIDYIVKRVPQTFDIIPKEGSIWKVDCIVTYPNVNNGFPVVELSNERGEWLRLPKSLVYEQ